MWRRALLLIFLGGALYAQQPPSAPTVRAETIRGRVTNDSGRALPSVTVIATRAPDRAFQQAITDTAGRYEIRFEQGTGDYLVYAAPVGYRAFRRRVTLPAANPTLTLDIRITAEAAVLAAVQVNAPRPRPIPDGAFIRDPTAAEYNEGGVNARLAPDQTGDLAALATTIPGISLTPDGRLVAFGVPGQMSTTYNGLTLLGAEIPRDTRMQVSVLTSAYDPSIGGFGGGRVNVLMGQGGRIHESFGRATIDAPAFQFVDAAAERLGQQFTQGVVSGLADGPLGEKDGFYNMGLQTRRYQNDARSLLDADRDLLRLAGIAMDSANHARQIATSLGIPLITSALPGSRVEQSASFVGRLDGYKDPLRYRRLWDNAINFTTLASFNRSDAPGAGPTTAPGFGRLNSSATGQGILHYMHRGDWWAAEVMNTVGMTRGWTRPYLDLPTARVRVLSSLDTAEPVTGSLTLGGSATAPSTTTNALWETVGYFNFFAGQHKMKLYARSKLDRVEVGASAGSSGTFTFNSLADLEDNRPAAFSRAFGVPSNSAAAWLGAFSVGDLWQVSRSLQLQPGLRIEANHFLSSPARNAALESALAITNATTPGGIHASPRLGFAWTWRQDRFVRPYGSTGVGRIAFPALGTLSGGIGEFRNDLGVSSVLGPITSTGLLTGPRQLTCVGSAVPVPNWRAYATDASSIPTQCAGGANQSFSDAAPSVFLFDPSYTNARSWRGNLRWGSVYRGRLAYFADAAYSYNVNQPGIREVNFTNVPRFTLSNEGGRPVFVGATSIVPSSGVLTTTDGRRSQAFGRVTQFVSDLHSTAPQVTVQMAPIIDRTTLSVTYTWTQVRETLRGFDGSTFDSPVDLQSGRSRYDVRHRFMISTGRQMGVVGASLFWMLSSGAPYTPLVASDINGDGYANDRAFIFDPAGSATNPGLASGLRSVMASAPSQARNCLMRQLGTAARSNSCEGPWTGTMNAALTTSYFHVGNRLYNASLNFINPLGGIDRLMHGDTHLRGWGTASPPNPILYSVRGFDLATQQYQYIVNSRFGSSRATETLVRAPFRISLDVRIELGETVREKQFRRFLEVSAIDKNHAAAPVDSLKRRLADLVPSYYEYFLRLRDSLLLTPAQVAAYVAADSTYKRKIDPLWRELALYIYERRDNPRIGEFATRAEAARRQAWAIQREEIPRLRAGLAPAQLELANMLMKTLIESSVRVPPGAVLF